MAATSSNSTDMCHSNACDWWFSGTQDFASGQPSVSKLTTTKLTSNASNSFTGLRRLRHHNRGKDPGIPPSLIHEPNSWAVGILALKAIFSRFVLFVGEVATRIRTSKLFECGIFGLRLTE